MKHHYVLAAIFSFILLSSLFAVSQSTTQRTVLAMESLHHLNLAYAVKQENASAVLGVATGEAATGEFSITATVQSTPLKLIQENHIVVVEYTESGAVVRAIDKKGLEESDRDLRKSWNYTVNSYTPTLPPDRMIVQPGDKVVWSYR